MTIRSLVDFFFSLYRRPPISPSENFTEEQKAVLRTTTIDTAKYFDVADTFKLAEMSAHLWEANSEWGALNPTAIPSEKGHTRNIWGEFGTNIRLAQLHDIQVEIVRIGKQPNRRPSMQEWDNRVLAKIETVLQEYLEPPADYVLK